MIQDRSYKVSIVALGCPKNLVDSEVIAGHLARGAFEFVMEPEEADAVIINTCGFVDEAKRESLETIRDILRLKEGGRLSSVVVAGCLVQRFREALKKQLPEVDAFLPITDYSGIPQVLHALRTKQTPGPLRSAGGGRRTHRTDLGRSLLTAPHVSYLRISEGCNHRCSFCAIPGIRGKLKSKPVEVLIEETQALAGLGVKEINLVAEDSTDYGRDLSDRSLLPELLERLGQVEGIRWIRLLYAYPSRVTEELMTEMARNPKVLPYIDMPVQHIHAPILKRMYRGTSPRMIRQVIDDLRERIPGIAIRTSVIVGYPGETEEAFCALCDFLDEVRFERMGAFLFSPEEGTAAYRLKNRVPEKKARERLGQVMILQRAIIQERNKSLVGAKEEVIVDTRHEDGLFLGRTRADAPDIDCAVWVRSKRNLKAGTILKVRITGFEDYDLTAVPLPEEKRSSEAGPGRG
ncbi:MAG: 30S ribosomal protein S12 methylthiotransferase RimO [Planctomycetota bacterium]